MAEGRLGGEFFTPHSIVRLIVEIIEPFHGKVFDPACGSGGMFVQCAKFVERHSGSPTRELSVYGQEQKEATVPLGQDEPRAPRPLGRHPPRPTATTRTSTTRVGRFDFVMANPPFNVNGVDKDEARRRHARFPFGLPAARQRQLPLDPALLLGAQRDAAAPASSWPTPPRDAGAREPEIRRKLIETGAVDVMVAIGPNFFYTVTLPVTLWFLDRGKRGTAARGHGALHRRPPHLPPDRPRPPRLPARADRVPRQHRPPLPRRGAPRPSTAARRCSTERFPDGTYVDVPGLCKVATLAEIEAQGWSLNPGRYIGTARRRGRRRLRGEARRAVRRVHAAIGRGRRAAREGRRGQYAGFSKRERVERGQTQRPRPHRDGHHSPSEKRVVVRRGLRVHHANGYRRAFPPTDSDSVAVGSRARKSSHPGNCLLGRLASCASERRSARSA